MTNGHILMAVNRAFAKGMTVLLANGIFYPKWKQLKLSYFSVSEVGCFQ